MKVIATIMSLVLSTSPAHSLDGNLVYLIRHAEKAEGEDPPLTEAGRERASGWSSMLRDSEIGVVISSTSRRTRETGDIVSDALGITRIEVETSQPSGVVDLIEFDYADVSVLVVGHTETLGTIMRQLGATDVPELDPADFDRLFVVVPGSGVLSQLRMP